MTKIAKAAIKVEVDAAMDTLPLKIVLDLVFNSRSPEYVGTLLEKLTQEGITEPKGLQRLSREGILTIRGSKQTFNMGEVFDIVSIHRQTQARSLIRPSVAIGRSCRHYERPNGGKKGGGKAPVRKDHRDRSRSGGRRNNRRGSNRNGGPIGGRKGGKGRSKGNSRRHSPARDTGPPPALWMAAEEGNVDTCRFILNDQSRNVDEPYKLWTPLMKAAEKGYIEIALLLLCRGADITAVNRKGRDALSFAAAPSMKRASTDDHCCVLRSLVEYGADPLRKDQSGQTAKERAKQESRHDIARCLEELEGGIFESFRDLFCVCQLLTRMCRLILSIVMSQFCPKRTRSDTKGTLTEVTCVKRFAFRPSQYLQHVPDYPPLA